jgi:FAD:protein FMN transferase
VSEIITTKAPEKSKWIIWGFLVSIIILLFFTNKMVVFSGETMGTTYYIKASIPRIVPISFLEYRLKKRLSNLDETFSTYRDDSELMMFNKHDSIHPFSISDELVSVLYESQLLFQMSNELWDPTIYPLMNLWGLYDQFGTEVSAPSLENIDKSKRSVDFNFVSIQGNELVKTNPDVYIDLSSIAKGYSVDQLSIILERYKSDSFLVEIGGEVRSKGVKRDGQVYKVGINTPDINASPYDVILKVDVTGKALATSGNYRRYRLDNGRVVSHIINPKTGLPVETDIVSVTVAAPTCSMADGLATAIMVMGREVSLALIEDLVDTEVCIIEKYSEELLFFKSSGFSALSL